MNDIETRLRAAEDRLEILELEGRYARFFDDHDGDSWAALFTADGIYQSRSTDGQQPATFVQGTDALRDYCTSAPFHGIHLFHLPQLTFDGDTAAGRIHLEYHGEWTEDPGAPVLHLVGFYDASYRRVDGAWRLARRVTTAFSRTMRTSFGYLPGTGLTSRDDFG